MVPTKKLIILLLRLFCMFNFAFLVFFSGVDHLPLGEFW